MTNRSPGAQPVRDRYKNSVKRDDGVYENVTARNGDSRYMVKGKPETVPDLSKTISD